MNARHVHERYRHVPFTRDYFSGTYGCEGLKKFDTHWWSVRMYASIADRWLRIIHGTRVLEVGCGYGFTLGRLEKKYVTFGVDISEHAIRQTARFAPRSKCFVADIEDALPSALQDCFFDMIIARYVLEHLRDPAGTVKRLAQYLRPGGLLFFSVPNTESIGARWKGNLWYARKDPTHISLLSPRSWIDAVQVSGLSVLKETSDGYWDVPYLSWLPGWLQLPLFLGPTAFACITGRDILPAGFGENIMLIAQKPAHGGSAR